MHIRVYLIPWAQTINYRRLVLGVGMWKSLLKMRYNTQWEDFGPFKDSDQCCPCEKMEKTRMVGAERALLPRRWLKRKVLWVLHLCFEHSW